MKELKFQVYWIPNFKQGFNYPVKNLFEAYYALSILNGLENVEGDKLITDIENEFPELKHFGNKLKRNYLAFKKFYWSWSPPLVESSFGGLEVYSKKSSKKSLYNFSDGDENVNCEDSYTFKSILEYVSKTKTESPEDWQNKLNNFCNYLTFISK